MQRCREDRLEKREEIIYDLLIFSVVALLHVLAFYLFWALTKEKPRGETLQFEVVNVGAASGGKAAAKAIAPPKKRSPAPKKERVVKKTPPPVKKPAPQKKTPLLTAKEANPEFAAPPPTLQKKPEPPKTTPPQAPAAPAASREAAAAENGTAGAGSGTQGSGFDAAGSGFNKGRYIQIGPKIYPLAARVNGEEGVVRIEVEVNREGKTLGARVVQSSGITRLDRAAVETARTKYRYEPNKKNGVPEETKFIFNIIFKLED